MSLPRKTLAVLAAVALLPGSVTAASADQLSIVTKLWVSSFEVCELVPGALCLQTEDGSVLQVTDSEVTLGGTDCVNLPKEHGSYVRVYDNLNTEALEPDLTAEMGTGSCSDRTPDPLDTVIVDADAHLTHPIDAYASAGHGGFSGDATFYEVGLGACGINNSDSELVAAIPASQFDPYTPNGNPNKNANCGRKAKVTRGGKSVTVTVVDRCAGCKFGDIDLSPAAFNQIAKPEDSRVKETWTLIS